MNDRECCGTCRWHKHCYAEYVCDNDESDAYGCETDYKDDCEDWEGRQNAIENETLKN